MKLWACHVGYGLYVVRAETKEEAAWTACVGVGSNGKGQYVPTDEALSSTEVVEIDVEGPRMVVAEYYA